MRLALLICAVLTAASPSWAASAHWVGAWGASPTAPQPASPGVPERLLSPRFENQTIFQVVRLSAGGQRLRLRLTNEYGVRPLKIGALRVAVVDAQGMDVPGSARVVTFAGARTTSIPPGAPMLSDPVDLPTPRLARLRVSLYLPDQTGPCTCHMSGQEYVSVDGPGDLTAQPAPTPTGPAQFRAFLSGVEVEPGAQSRVIVALGDSITDGYLSTPGTDRRWPDRLAERLVERHPKRTFGVVNAGIGGNRVLSDAVVAVMGQSALTRFDRDVLSVAGATDLMVLEGVNDLGARVGRPSAEDLIAGYRQLIARAHAHGLRIIGGTILPYEGAGYFTAEGEATRQAVNAWIRAPGNFDAVIDFDAAIRDPAKPSRMRAGWHAGDWLHPNDAGYRAMGDAVDLALFR
jgi:lysophospholipase L1-like esterase